MKGLCRIALAALFLAACGRDGAITEPVEPTTPPPISGGILALGVDSTTGASIETNRDDYSPGEVVHVVGRGWAPGETVNLHMTESPDTHADVDTNVVADGSGGFSIHYYDVQTHDLGVTFTLTATGAASHGVAVATFTDAVNLRIFGSSDGSTEHETLATEENLGTVTVGSPLVLTCPRGSGLVVRAPGSGNDNQNWSLAYGGTGSNNAVLSPLTTLTPNNGTLAGANDTKCVAMTIATGTLASGTTYQGSLQISGPNANSSLYFFRFTVQASNTAPTLNNIADQNVNEGSPLSFTATASDTDTPAQTLTYTLIGAPAGATIGSSSGIFSWTPSDGPAQSTSFTVRVTDNGTPTMFDEQTVNVAVANVAPTATFNAPPSVPGGSNFNISLTSPGDVSSNDVSAGFQYAFDCGSGYNSFSTTNSRSCTAGAPGSLNVKGKIKDKDGAEREYTASVAVDNVPPTADAGGSYSGNEGSPVNITGSGSDPDGGAVSYLWSAAPAGKCSFGDATLASTTVTCTDNGAYTLTLKVTDNELVFTTDDATLNVANVAPTIGTHTLGTTVNEGSSIPFAVGGVTDPSSDDQTTGFTYAFSCNGAPYGAFGISNTVSCPAGDGPGSVTIAGKARDKDGGISAPVSSTFNVLNVQPTITAVTTNSPVNEGSNATLTVTTVTDPWAGDLVGAEYSFACDGVAYGPFGPSNSVNCPTTDGPATLTIGAKVKDKDGAVSDAFTQNITVANVAPTVTGVAAPSSVNEGPGTFAFSATGVTDPSAPDVAFGFQYAFSCDNGATWSGFSTTNSGSCAAPDGPATIAVAVKARDKDLGESTPVTKNVTVNNLKPTVTGVTAPASVPEGPSFNFSASGVTDPSPVDQAGPFTYAFSCDNGGTWTAFGPNSGSCSAPDGPATVNVAVKAKDKDGAESDPQFASVTVNNVVPTVTGVTAPASVLEGPTPFNFSATGVTDPSTPDQSAGFEYAFSCNNGATWSAYSTTNSGTCAATDGPSTVNIAVKAKDKDGGESLKASASVTVNNVAPTLTSVTGSITPVAVGTSTAITLAFSDPANTLDSYTASVNWDDGYGYVSGGTVTPGGTVSKTFSQAGVYTVCAKVSDEDGGTSGEQCYAYIVAYDPTGGFVTGGGWINSLAGYYRLNTAAEGKANFGFVSKYLPGRTVPTGNTEFQFHTGSLNFKSTTYEWLVVAGTKALYKGEGTIAGQPGVYGFLLSAIDGSPDKFRIKIWDKTTGNVVYDTLPAGAEDDADPTTTLGGGSIVVHTKK